MLQPLQLQEVSDRFSPEIAELRGFLAKAGTPVGTDSALSGIAARLRTDRAFHRDLMSYIWVVLDRCGAHITYPDLLAVLALAAAGHDFAPAADEDDAHSLLRFLMEARHGFETTAQPPRTRTAADAPAAVPVQVSTPRMAAEPPVRPGQQQAATSPFAEAAASWLPVHPPAFNEEREDERAILRHRSDADVDAEGDTYPQPLRQSLHQPPSQPDREPLPRFSAAYEDVPVAAPQHRALWAAGTAAIAALLLLVLWLGFRRAPQTPGTAAVPTSSQPVSQRASQPALQPAHPSSAVPSPGQPAGEAAAEADNRTSPIRAAGSQAAARSRKSELRPRTGSSAREGSSALASSAPIEREAPQAVAAVHPAESASAAAHPAIGTSAAAAPARAASAAAPVFAPRTTGSTLAANGSRSIRIPSSTAAFKPLPAVPSGTLATRLGSPSVSADIADRVLTPDGRLYPHLIPRHPPTNSGTSGYSAPVQVAEARPAPVPGSAPAPDNTRPFSTAPSMAAAPSGIVRPTTLGMMAAYLVYSPAPSYPVQASAAHVQGQVKLEADIDRQGNVASARVVSGPPLLRDAALEAVQQWRYRPFRSGGKPIPVTATTVFDFELP